MNRSQEPRNDEDTSFDAFSDSERVAPDRNGDVAAFSDVSSECETSVCKIENVLDACNDPTYVLLIGYLSNSKVLAVDLRLMLSYYDALQIKTTRSGLPRR